MWVRSSIRRRGLLSFICRQLQLTPCRVLWAAALIRASALQLGTARWKYSVLLMAVNFSFQQNNPGRLGEH